ncbi:MAG: arylsulfatase [Fimbriiglobus sp.]|nr:arylsulfatase [Fimbriiglobus sp.]
MRAALVALLLASLAVAAPPNVLVVITDDQGYGDLGAHGNPILKTPHLDAFAKEAVHLKRFHVSPVCSPTRSSLLTGLWNYRTGVVDTFIGRSMMRPGVPTLAEHLSAAGYRTGLFGKWHLGDHFPLRPEDRGFGTTLWHHSGGLGQPGDLPGSVPGKEYFDPILTKNGKETKAKGYCTDAFTDAALDFITAKDGRPFFAYVAFNAPHGPYQVPEADAAPYRKINLSAQAFPKVGQPWGAANAKPDEIANAYGMIANLDANFGRLMKTLADKKLADNTVVIFLTDNGPGGVRFNGGLRNRKGTVYDGGIRVPCYIRWPAKLGKGRVIDTPLTHVDLTPTLLEMTGAKPAKAVAFDGVSFLPLLTGEKKDLPERTLFIQWHRGDEPEKFRAFAAVGPRYKLVQAAGTSEGKNWKPKFELFDIPADEFEQTDLAEKLPDEVAKLKGQYDVWFADVTKLGFAPPRIPIGTEQAPSVRLTRQDWRGPDAGWTPTSIGHWMIAPAKDDDYELVVRAKAAFTGLSWETTTGKGAVTDLSGVKGHTLAVRLTTKDEQVKVTLTADGKTFGPDTVEVRRK